jgi:hypothetical protein
MVAKTDKEINPDYSVAKVFIPQWWNNGSAMPKSSTPMAQQNAL